MKASLQRQIAPQNPVAKSLNFSDQKVKNAPTGRVAAPGSDVDFKSLLLNSNKAEQARQEARSNGDLSSADSYQDFLNELNRQTDQQRVPKNSLDKNDFLTLFVTQLQHQDPLNPKDGAEMASQLAEFNGLEQMMNVNKALERLEGAQKASQSLNYINYIGKEVAMNGGKVQLDGTKMIGDVSYKPAAPANQTMLEVRDAAGTVVATKDLGPSEGIENKLVWDGLGKDGEKLPKGTYSFAINAKNMKGEDVPVEVSTRVKITGLNLSDENTKFYTSLGEMDFTEIAAIGESGFGQHQLSSNGAGAPQGPAAKAVGTATKDVGNELAKAPQAAENPVAPGKPQNQAVDPNALREQLAKAQLQQAGEQEKPAEQPAQIETTSNHNQNGDGKEMATPINPFMTQSMPHKASEPFPGK